MDTLDNIFQDTDRPKIVGQWSKLVWEPDPTTQEKLNIGVIFCENETEKSYFKMLETFNRLECLYDEQATQSLKYIVKQIKSFEGIQQLIESNPFSNITISEPLTASGDEVDQISNDIFKSVVTLARPKNQKEKSTYSGFTQESLVKYVSNMCLKSLDAYVYKEYFHTESDYVFFDDNKHFLNIPVYGPKIASIASCAYSTKASAEVKLKDAFIELSVAGSLQENKNKPKRIFALFPDDNLKLIDRKSYDEIFNMIDELEWKAKKNNIILEGQDDIDVVAGMVSDFCEA
ncbi:MAG: hypothetical protein ABNH21_06750 [Glaciecola sp.]|jgi:hypothetical protein